MTQKGLNILLFLCLASTVILNWMVSTDFKKPNREFLPEMVRSIPYDAFSPNPNFADGKTLQQPAPGTIVRGYMPLHYESTEDDAIRAGLELVNPFTPDSVDAELRGAYIYKDFCLPCHGPTGMGNGPVALRGYPPPPPLSEAKTLKMKDGQMFHILTYGQGNMPDYRSQLTRLDRWKVILHVRKLQRQSDPTLTPPPETGEGIAESSSPIRGRK